MYETPFDDNLPRKPRADVARVSMRTLLVAASGGALEFYDFVIFVFFAKAIAHDFFPPEIPDWLKDLQAFGIFAAGYLARPLGGLLMAHRGDLGGRKRVFLLSLFLMAVATFAIGLLPGYNRLGYLAPCLLLGCRLLQGAAVGGEVPGAWVFASEHAGPGRTGLACGLLTAGLTSGIFLGSIVNFTLSTIFTNDDVMRFAWRYPFLLGGALGLVGMVFRRSLEESPVYQELRRRASRARETPVRSVLSRHRPAVALSMLATWQLTAVIVVVILMGPTLLSPPSNAAMVDDALAGTAATAALTVGCVMVGWAIDSVGLAPLLALSGPMLAGAAYLLFWGESLYGQSVTISAVVGFLAGFITVVPALLVRMFPPAIAFSGVALSYNAAYAIAGGLTPPAILYAFHRNSLAPAHYVAAISMLVSVLTLQAARNRSTLTNAGSSVTTTR